ncbi:MAG: hypothetical protein ACYCSO_05295 [Cuniculiplasma sp.]
MVSESKKMKISISLERDEFEFLKGLVESRTAANFSHAVRLCVKAYAGSNEHSKEEIEE